MDDEYTYVLSPSIVIYVRKIYQLELIVYCVRKVINILIFLILTFYSRFEVLFNTNPSFKCPLTI